MELLYIIHQFHKGPSFELQTKIQDVQLLFFRYMGCLLMIEQCSIWNSTTNEAEHTCVQQVLDNIQAWVGKHQIAFVSQLSKQSSISRNPLLIFNWESPRPEPQLGQPHKYHGCKGRSEAGSLVAGDWAMASQTFPLSTRHSSGARWMLSACLGDYSSRNSQPCRAK